MKKRIVTVILSMSLAAGLLAGCGSKDPAVNTTTVQAQSVTEADKGEAGPTEKSTESATGDSTEPESDINKVGESGVTTVDVVNPPIDEETGETIAPTEEANPTEEAKPTEAVEDKKEDAGSVSNSKYDEAFRAK